jgi:DNA-binding PadR family transcriptional regulator
MILTPNETLITISLYHSPKCACQLASDIDKGDTVIANNLRKMQEEKIVTHERTGIRKKYRLTSQGNQLYDLLIVHNDGFRELVSDYETKQREDK